MNDAQVCDNVPSLPPAGPRQGVHPHLQGPRRRAHRRIRPAPAPPLVPQLPGHHPLKVKRRPASESEIPNRGFGGSKYNFFTCSPFRRTIPYVWTVFTAGYIEQVLPGVSSISCSSKFRFL
jgi:hypothetical protein